MAFGINVTSSCPDCGTHFTLPGRLLGKQTKCVKCGSSFTIVEEVSAGHSVKEAFPQVVEQLGNYFRKDQQPDSASKSSLEDETLTNCPDCHAKVSRRAAACPSCGAPLDQHDSTSLGREPILAGSATEPFAVLTLVSGILSLLFLPIVFAPMALVCGAVATNNLNRNPALGGHGMRTWGMALAGFSLLIMFVRLASINFPS